MNPFDEDLVILATDLSKFAQKLRKLGVDRDNLTPQRLEKIVEGLSQTPCPWLELQPHEVLSPILLIEHARSAYRRQTRWLGYFEALRNVLVLFPILLTWLALSQASAAYNLAVAADPSNLLTVPFLLQWEGGFSGHISSMLGIPLTFSHVALADFVLLGIIILLTVVVHAQSNVMAERADLDAMQRGAELDDLMWRLSRVLQQKRVSMGGDAAVRNEATLVKLTQFLELFSSQGQGYLMVLKQEQEHLQKLAEYREKEIHAIESFSSKLQLDTQQLLDANQLLAREVGKLQQALAGYVNNNEATQRNFAEQTKTTQQQFTDQIKTTQQQFTEQTQMAHQQLTEQARAAQQQLAEQAKTGQQQLVAQTGAMLKDSADATREMLRQIIDQTKAMLDQFGTRTQTTLQEFTTQGKEMQKGFAEQSRATQEKFLEQSGAIQQKFIDQAGKLQQHIELQAKAIQQNQERLTGSLAALDTHIGNLEKATGDYTQQLQAVAVELSQTLTEFRTGSSDLITTVNHLAGLCSTLAQELAKLEAALTAERGVKDSWVISIHEAAKQNTTMAEKLTAVAQHLDPVLSELAKITASGEATAKALAGVADNLEKVQGTLVEEGTARAQWLHVSRSVAGNMEKLGKEFATVTSAVQVACGQLRDIADRNDSTVEFYRGLQEQLDGYQLASPALGGDGAGTSASGNAGAMPGQPVTERNWFDRAHMWVRKRFS